MIKTLLTYLNILSIPIKKGYIIDLKGNEFAKYEIDLPYDVETGDIFYISIDKGFDKQGHIIINLN